METQEQMVLREIVVLREIEVHVVSMVRMDNLEHL